MFYRQGGSDKRISVQFDEVYTDAIDGASGWLPVNRGNSISINIARASLTFVSAVASRVIKSPVAPECTIIMEMKMTGNGDPWPIDQWQNIVVSTFRPATRDGLVRLRVVNINNGDGTGVALAMQVSRNGDSGRQA